MSNIPITPGTGVSSVATETISGIDYQKIKVVDGTASSTTVMKVNADGSLGASIVGTAPVTMAGAWTASVVGTIFVAGSVATIGAAVANQSVSGTVGASVIGTVPVVQSGTVITSITGIPSVSGTLGASVIGTVPVVQSGIFITSITGIPSVSGTVGASVIGTAPVTQSGAWSASVVGGPISLYAPTASLVSGVSSVITSTSQTSVLATAPGAQRNYITQMLITNGAAVGTFVDVMDGGNVIYSGYAAASGGGFSATFPAPLKQPNSVQSLDVKARTQASIIAAVSGFTAA